MRTRVFIVVLTLTAIAGTQAAQDPIDRIREADLKRDLFALAGDAMRGREAGTIDEMTASAWVAERAREAGLQPAGDNGTYFQFFPLERLRVSASSTVTLAGKDLRWGVTCFPTPPCVANIDAPVTVVDGDSFEGRDLKGRVLVVRYAPAQPATQDAGPRTAAALRTWVRGIQRTVTTAAPAAIVAIVPEASQRAVGSRGDLISARQLRARSRRDWKSRSPRRTACRCSTCGSRRWAAPCPPTRAWSRPSSPTPSPIRP